MTESKTPANSSAATATPGLVLANRYELQSPIASGGMAQVWRAYDEMLDRRVAIKVLHPHLATDDGFVARFRREAVAAARLSHNSIVAIYDTISNGQLEAIVMELINGDTLRTALNEKQTLEPDEIVRVGVHIAEALAEAHRAGIIHRDIKPANIIMTAERIMVTDFGIAKAGGDIDLTDTGTLLGTAKYLAPEQVLGERVDPRSDLYSLGVVLYEAAAGRVPFLADNDAATALQRLHQEPPPIRSLNKNIPVGLVTVIDRLLERNPDDRYERASSLRAELQRADLSLTVEDPTAVNASEAATQKDQRRVHSKPPAPPQRDTAPQSKTRSAPLRPPPSTAPTPAAVLDDLSASYHRNDFIKESDQNQPYDQKKKSWLLPALVGLVVTTVLAVGFGLLLRPDASTGLPKSETKEKQTAVITAATPFDPFGDKSEGEKSAAFSFDSDLTTFWRTETYKGENQAGLKDGVGLILTLENSVTVEEVQLNTNSNRWDIELYSGSSFTGDQNWGEPVLSVTGGEAGDNLLKATGPEASGEKILIWITNTGSSSKGFRFELNEIVINP